MDVYAEAVIKSPASIVPEPSISAFRFEHCPDMESSPAPSIIALILSALIASALIVPLPDTSKSRLPAFQLFSKMSPLERNAILFNAGSDTFIFILFLVLKSSVEIILNTLPSTLAEIAATTLGSAVIEKLCLVPCSTIKSPTVSNEISVNAGRSMFSVYRSCAY